jgi:hypothetical protein
VIAIIVAIVAMIAFVFLSSNVSSSCSGPHARRRRPGRAVSRSRTLSTARISR